MHFEDVNLGHHVATRGLPGEFTGGLASGAQVVDFGLAHFALVDIEVYFGEGL